MNQPGRAPRLARTAYTPWVTRVLAYLIDVVPAVIVFFVGIAIEVGTRQRLCAATTTPYDIAPYCATGNSYVGLSGFLGSMVIALVYLVWNYGYRQGRTGSSLGKSVLKCRVVDERSGQPIGFGRSVLRQFAHAVDAVICYVGFLFPLWDARRQTLADKLLKTVCVPVSGTR